MFNSTHTLVGLGLARAGLGRGARRAAATAVIASNLPDIDIVTQFFGTATYLDLHRGITHTFVGILLLSLLLAGLMTRRSGSSAGPPPAVFKNLFTVALVTMLTHPLLDWTNTYGVRPFLPFSGKWYYGDLLFVIDPYLDLILLASLFVSYRVARRQRTVAVLGLAVAVVYGATMLQLRSKARARLTDFALHLPDADARGVSPHFLDPFQWSGFVTQRGESRVVTIDSRTGEVHGQTTMGTAADSAVTRAVEASYAARVFRGFARFPVARVSRTESGYRVLLIDLRFYRPPSRTALSAEFLLDDTLRITAESISFVRNVD
jgi:inner membrane protein